MKKFVVTGSAVGIGFQIAIDLLKQGYFVILNDIDENALSLSIQSIENKGFTNYSYLVGDSSTQEFRLNLFNLIDDSPGDYYGLIANAGITTFGSFWDYQPDSMNKILETNIKGTFFLIQQSANYFRSNKIKGSIVVITSVTGHQAHPDLAVYGMTKAALSQLVKNLVIDLSPYQIRINAVSPGATITERTTEDKNYQEIWTNITPLKKPARVEDISNAVNFFLSEKSTHITGQTLIVDGGWTSISPPPNS
ncbi:MAG: hypothetical protein RIR51_1297 [Bacteroidota bacterium]|jgi:3-oxoacyl-[acyl-carrier protein] reductase